MEIRDRRFHRSRARGPWTLGAAAPPQPDVPPPQGEYCCAASRPVNARLRAGLRALSAVCARAPVLPGGRGRPALVWASSGPRLARARGSRLYWPGNEPDRRTRRTGAALCGPLAGSDDGAGGRSGLCRGHAAGDGLAGGHRGRPASGLGGLAGGHGQHAGGRAGRSARRTAGRCGCESRRAEKGWVDEWTARRRAGERWSRRVGWARARCRCI